MNKATTVTVVMVILASLFRGCLENQEQKQDRHKLILTTLDTEVERIDKIKEQNEIREKEAEKERVIKEKKEKDKSHWEYSESKDDLSGKISKIALTKSTNTFNLSSPYEGEQRATLYVRKHARYGHDIYIVIEQGQLICSYDNCLISVNFGDKVEKFSVIKPADGSSEFFFIANTRRFYKRLKKTKEVKVELMIYQEGSRTVTFNTRKFPSKL